MGRVKGAGRCLSKKKDAVPFIASASESFLENNWVNYSGMTTSYAFDELGRVTQTTLPDGLTTRTIYDGWSREGIDQKGHKRRYEADWAGRTVAVKEYTGVDPSCALYATTTYSYDLANQLTGVLDAASHTTTITYDALGRKVAMTDPDMGTWSYDYDPVGTLSAQVDAREVRTEYAYDKLGRLVRKWHRPSWTEEAVTNGTRVSLFDLMELRCAIDANRASLGLTTGGWTDEEIVAGNGVPIRAVHLTELRDRMAILWSSAGMGTLPEFSAGTITAGARSIKTSDPLDVRKWLEQYELSSYGQAHRARAFYEYDAYDGTAQFGRGRRTASWDGSGTEAVYYDRLGRAYRTERWIDGHLYTTQATFDALGRGYNTTLPDNEVVSYSYGAHGLLTQMASSLRVSYVSGVGYNVLGQPREYTLGSGTTATMSLRYHGLDSGTYPFGALKTIQLQRGTDPMLVDREMSYDEAGNVTGVNDRVNGENISYGYDDLDRLTSAGSPLNESYAYSVVGNITSKNAMAYSYSDPLHVHAVTAFGGMSYAYDANGSMTTRGAQAVRYDAERRPVRVNDGATVLWRAAYDGDGARRKRADAKGTIHYLGGYERNVGNGQDTTETVTKYYRALGRLIAIRKNGLLYWIGTDHLGGTIRVADNEFSPVGQMRYSPYGVSRDDPSLLPHDYLFTDQELDASVGLYWYGSRAYDQSLGRFACPDTIVPSAGNPQSLNRYAYAYNNPLRYADPSGHVAIPLAVAGYLGVAMAAAAFQAWWSTPDNPARTSVTKAMVELAVSLAELAQRESADAMEARYRVGGRVIDVYPEYADHHDRIYHGHIKAGKDEGYDVDLETGNILGTNKKLSGKDLDELHRQMGDKGQWPPDAPSDPGPSGDAKFSALSAAPVTNEYQMARIILLFNAFAASADQAESKGVAGGVAGIVASALDGNPTGVEDIVSSIPAGVAPGGVGVVNITVGNPSGEPEDGRGWDAQDREAREAAWIRGGAPDYNALRAAGVPGYC